jgi:hypothetical protein
VCKDVEQDLTAVLVAKKMLLDRILTKNRSKKHSKGVFCPIHHSILKNVIFIIEIENEPVRAKSIGAYCWLFSK